MSLANVEALRAIYEEWGRGNFRAGPDLYDARVMFVPLPDFPAGEQYTGPEGVAEFMRSFLAAWTELAITGEDFVEVGDSVMVSAHWRGVGQESGAPVELHCYDVWTFRGGTVVRVEFFNERSDALEAVGLPGRERSPNVDCHRRSTEAFNSRDVEAYLEFCDPQIELHSAVTVPGGAVYRGHDGVRKWHRDIADGFGSEVSVEPETFYDLGENTISFHVLHGRGRESGAEVAMPAAHLCRWRDGRIVYFKGFAQRDDAFRELGVSKDAVEPILP